MCATRGVALAGSQQQEQQNLRFVAGDQLLIGGAWLLHLIGDEAPPTEPDSNEVVRVLSWLLSSSRA